MSNLNPWLVVLIGFVIGWFAQWLFEVFYFRRKRTQALRQLQETEAALKARNAELGAERSRNATLQTENEALRASIAAQATFNPPQEEASVGESDAVAAAAAAVVATVVTDDEVAPMDGLGAITGLADPHRDELCAAGICTLEALADSTVDQIDAICQEPDHRRPDYASWILQAQELLAADGKWTDDDLSEIDGIDPTSVAILNEQGFTNFRRLAAADEPSLAHVIGAPPWRNIHYGHWIALARLAAAGDKAGVDALAQQQKQTNGDNLLLIEGIDDATAAALRAHGIDSFASLAAATPDQLAQIGQEAGLPAGNYEGWLAEAGMRAAGQHVRRAKNVQAPTGAIAWTPCPQYLSQVKGISPLYEHRLYAASIGTYWELASLDDDALARILAPRPWQEVDFSSIKADAAQLAEDTETVGRVWDGSLPDDLCVIDGVSRMYEARLHEAGICTFEALAEATSEQVAAICRAPDWRTPNYEAWIAAAQAKGGGPSS